jgi:dipeptidase E
MRLLLTSFAPSAEHDAMLAELIGKAPSGTRVAYIENAHDVYDDEEALEHGRADLRSKGYDVELVDLRRWRGGAADRGGLREALTGKDLFVLAGGNPFYLRWLMKATGADELITELVRKGTVYVGASAAAVVAGPTLRYFDNQDDPGAAEEVVWEGLGLTQTVVVPHIDNEHFGAGCREAGERLAAAGYATQPITDAQALLIVDGEQRVV